MYISASTACLNLRSHICMSEASDLKMVTLRVVDGVRSKELFAKGEIPVKIKRWLQVNVH